MTGIRTHVTCHHAAVCYGLPAVTVWRAAKAGLLGEPLYDGRAWPLYAVAKIEAWAGKPMPGHKPKKARPWPWKAEAECEDEATRDTIRKRDREWIALLLEARAKRVTWHGLIEGAKSRLGVDRKFWKE